ncbi:MAG: hypothetical protein Q8O31_08855 [Rhodocyclaceae bacterium]|nr:hypothetical protein [Rhodocyclaceae bacterium]
MDAEQKRRQYIDRLEGVVKQMLVPFKGVPFNLVIEAMTGHRVIEFNVGNAAHRRIMDTLIDAAKIAALEMNKQGIASKRVNEVGNKIEPFVRDAISRISGCQAAVPSTSTGKRKSAGYPDIEANIHGDICYVECKTFHADNVATTQRSFYFSPSDEFKVTRDALHFILSFEMYPTKVDFRTSAFKLLTLESLSLDVKHEFNSDNRRLYSGKDGTRLLHEQLIEKV